MLELSVARKLSALSLDFDGLWQRAASTLRRRSLASSLAIALFLAWLLGLPGLAGRHFGWHVLIDALTWPVIAAVGLIAWQRPQAVVQADTVRSVARVAWLSVSFVAASSIVFVWRRYTTFSAGNLDLALFDQVVFNFTRGDGFYSSLRLDRSFFADHFTPALALFAPLYFLAADPRTLMIAQVLLVAAAALPLFHACRRVSDATTAWLLVLLYAWSVPVRYLATVDFHPECLTILCLAAGLERASAKRFGQAVLVFVCSALIKESVALGVAGAGLVLVFAHRRPWLGSALFGFGLAYFVVMLLWVIPGFRQLQSYEYYGRYGHLGSGLVDIVKNLITRPYLAYHLFWPGQKVEYTLRLLAPLAFLPLLGWRYTIGASIVWAQNALANYPPMHSVHFQYNGEIIPFLWLGAAAGAARLKASRLSAGHGVVLSSALILTLALAEGSELSRTARNASSPRKARIAEALAGVDPALAVSTDPHLAPHLSRRKYVYLFPQLEGARPVDVVAVDAHIDPPGWLIDKAGWQRAVEALPAQGFSRVLEVDGFSLWSRR